MITALRSMRPGGNSNSKRNVVLLLEDAVAEYESRLDFNVSPTPRNPRGRFPSSRDFDTEFFGAQILKMGELTQNLILGFLPGNKDTPGVGGGGAAEVLFAWPGTPSSRPQRS